MLVLSRFAEQAVKIGPDITIKIISSKKIFGKRQYKIGIDAPKHILILRDELLITAQHEAPLEADGGPMSPPALAPTERVERGGPDLSVLGISQKNRRVR